MNLAPMISARQSRDIVDHWEQMKPSHFHTEHLGAGQLGRWVRPVRLVERDSSNWADFTENGFLACAVAGGPDGLAIEDDRPYNSGRTVGQPAFAPLQCDNCVPGFHAIRTTLNTDIVEPGGRSGLCLRTGAGERCSPPDQPVQCDRTIPISAVVHDAPG